MPELDLNLFLRAKDIAPEGTMVTFTDVGKTVSKEETGFGHDSFQIGVSLPNGDKRAWTMNKTAQRMVAEVWGTNSDAWVGKTALLKVAKVNVKGVEKDSITVSSG